VLFDSETLSEDFFAPNKGLLDNLLQKFTMYNIKAAIVIRDKNSLQSGLREAIAESERQGVIRLFTNIENAKKWFLSLKQ